MPGQLIDGIDPTAVTGGNAHDHVGGDGATVPYATGLSGQPTLGTAAAQDVGAFAAAANGVTNGDSHDHSGGDGAQIAYSGLSGLPTLGTAAGKDTGTGTDNVILGNDSRLTDTRDPKTHAASHTDGTDDIQSATAAQKGLMTAAYAAKLDAVGALTTNKTVNLTYDMTAAQIQALIDAQPKNLGGYTLTFQFGDGAYNTSMTAKLQFLGFYGGILIVQGNTGDTTPYEPGVTDPAVSLDFSAGTSDGLSFESCFADVRIANLHIKISSTVNVACCRVGQSAGRLIAHNLVCEGSGLKGSGVAMVNSAAASIYTSLFSGMYDGIYANCSRLFSYGNNDYSTQPKYGLDAGAAATIGKGGDQPGGSTNDELTDGGGEIR